MDTLKWTLFLVYLNFNVIQTDNSLWTIKVPSSVKGLPGSCVVIPCSFNFPNPSGKTLTVFTGMWTDATNQIIYHPDKSKVMKQYQNRAELIGDVVQKNCSLKIDPLQQSDTGPFHFRIEIQNLDKYSYRENTVSITMMNAPVNVRVEHKSAVKEGEAVQLTCSSDAHPPASSYEWYKETGARLYQGNVFMLPNVSRHHSGTLYCTAINEVGQGNSSLVQLNVLYAPEIKAISSCSSEVDMVKCVCIAESRPPSMVHFVLSDRVLPSTKVEKHDSVTIGTLQAELGSSAFVLCLANNTQGNANATLFLPVNSRMQSLYIIIAIGAGAILMILLTTVGVVKKCRGRSGEEPTSHMKTLQAEKDVELPQYAATKSKENYDDVHCPGIDADDPVYGNIEADDDAVYTNV